MSKYLVTFKKSYCIFYSSCTFSSVQSLSHVWLFAIPGTAAHQASLSITNWKMDRRFTIWATKEVILVHWVGDAIQPSHPLSSPYPPALNLSQHQGLFQWVGSSHQVAQVLEFQLQHQSNTQITSDDNEL